MTSPSIFLSYGHHDQIWCKELAAYIQSNGFDLWYDEALAPILLVDCTECHFTAPLQQNTFADDDRIMIGDESVHGVVILRCSTVVL
jgi:hypothetical protein